MSTLTDQAIAKITDEMMKIGTRNARRIEEYLTGICNNDIIAKKILEETRTLKMCISHCMNKAEEQKEGNCAMVEDDEVYEWVEEYYQIKPEDKTEVPNNVIDIMSIF